MTTVTMRFGNELAVQVSLREGIASVGDLLGALPFKSVVHRWGDEVYFDAPFHSDMERDARAEMEVGDVAFWPDGDAVAIFFGPTPVSTNGRPRAYSACNLLGKVVGSAERLKAVEEGASVEVLRT